MIANLEVYLKSDRSGKAACVLKILDEIQESRGRFLKRRPDGWWEEVEMEAAKEKISLAFRTTLSSHNISAVTRRFKDELPSTQRKRAKLNPVDQSRGPGMCGHGEIGNGGVNYTKM